MTEDNEMGMNKIVYLGRRMNGGKLCGVVILLSEADKIEKWDETWQFDVPICYYELPKKMRFIVGGIYEWKSKISEEGRVSNIVFSTKGFNGRYNREDFCIIWDASDDASYLQNKANKMLENLANQKLFENQLKRLKEIYKSTPAQSRTALKVMLLNYLEKP